jgi:putative phosphoesterase
LSPAALLYDVHGNLPALEAVLADIDAAGGVSGHVLGGDYAMFGPWPRETVERLGELEPAQWIRGNVDRWTANPHDAPDDPVPQGAIVACREALGDELVAELGALPEQLVIDGVRYCHGSPVSDVMSFFPEPAENEDELVGGVSERMIVFGHTHLPFEREGPDGVLLVNPGSVGIPLDGDTRAAYALLHEDGLVEHRRVEYDAQASADALRERFEGEFVEVIARRIERAQFESG